MACSGWVESIGVANKDAVFAMLVGLAKQFDIQVLVLRTYPQYLCSRVNNKEGKRVSNAGADTGRGLGGQMTPPLSAVISLTCTTVVRR